MITSFDNKVQAEKREWQESMNHLNKVKYGTFIFGARHYTPLLYIGQAIPHPDGLKPKAISFYPNLWRL